MDLKQAVEGAGQEFDLFRLLHETTSIDRLSADTHIPPATLQRLLRGLVHFDYCMDLGRGQYRLKADSTQNRAGEATPSSDQPSPVARMLLYSLRTGKPAFERAFGMPFFTYLDHNNDARERFGSLMSVDTSSRARRVATLIDCSQARHVVDVGGGFGRLTIELLRENRSLRATILDRPAVTDRAWHAIQNAGLVDRVNVVGGDFFQAIPTGADVYLYSQVLHDWDDDQCRDLLRTCRLAMNSNSTLLLVEALIPDPVVPNSPAVELDLMMMLLTGGRERTWQEYASLVHDSGFQIFDTRPIDDVFSVLVVNPAADPKGRT